MLGWGGLRDAGMGGGRGRRRGSRGAMDDPAGDDCERCGDRTSATARRGDGASATARRGDGAGVATVELVDVLLSLLRISKDIVYLTI
jgi:hypothetical protein